MHTRHTTVPPRWVRMAHWTNAFCFAVMLASGWQIYGADPFWTPAFPAWATLGGSLPGALQWHLAAMWLLTANGLVAVGLLVISGRFKGLYLSANPSGAARGEAHRHPLQRLAYLGVLALLAVEVASGLSMWKPVQFQALSGLLGGYEMTRRLHFAGMAALACFAVGHIALALASPRLLMGMLGVGRRVQEPAP
jgi:thiosulfate reductase cytochrome b subunit